jgi:hypothetical protein
MYRYAVNRFLQVSILLYRIAVFVNYAMIVSK